MAPRDTAGRRKAFTRGVVSEYVAAAWLMARGYRIVAMRYRCKAGEIDIVARRGDLVAFIEVKARTSTEASVFAVDAHTQRRIRNASLAWLTRQPDGGRLSLSYDIVAVRPWRLPVHMRDAF